MNEPVVTIFGSPKKWDICELPSSFERPAEYRVATEDGSVWLYPKSRSPIFKTVSAAAAWRDKERAAEEEKAAKDKKAAEEKAAKEALVIFSREDFSNYEKTILRNGVGPSDLLSICDTQLKKVKTQNWGKINPSIEFLYRQHMGWLFFELRHTCATLRIATTFRRRDGSRYGTVKGLPDGTPEVRKIIGRAVKGTIADRVGYCWERAYAEDATFLFDAIESVNQDRNLYGRHWGRW